MSKIDSLYNLTASYGSTAALNTNFTRIMSAFNNTLSRDGSSPNSMNAVIDMNGNQVINLADPTLPHHAVPLGFLQDYVAAATGTAEVPSSNEYLNIEDYFVAGDSNWTNAVVRLGVASNTLNKEGLLPSGRTYDINAGVSFSNSCHLKMGRTAVWKVVPSTGAVSSIWGVRFLASNSSLTGGKFDFDRNSWNKTAYNAAGGAGGYNYWAVYVAGNSGSLLTNVKIDTKIVNAVVGLVAFYAPGIYVDLEVETSGSGSYISNCDRAVVKRAVMTGMDQDAWRIYGHGFDVAFSDNVSCGPVIIKDQTGNDSVATQTSMSDWYTAATLTGVTNSSFSRFILSSDTSPSIMRSVGLSVLNGSGLSFDNLNIRFFTAVQLELGTVYKSTFSNFFFDGGWHTLDGTVNTTDSQMGIHSIAAGFYSDFVRRSVIGTREVKFVNGTIQRMLLDGTRVYQGTDLDFVNVSFKGNQTGAVTQPYVNPNFSGGSTITPRNINFSSCKFENNELSGMTNRGVDKMTFRNCAFRNNGQLTNSPTPAVTRYGNAAYTAERTGYLGVDTSPAVARSNVKFFNCLFEDDQTNTSATGSIDPAAPTIVTSEFAHLYDVGSAIRVVNGATGPANLNTYVTKVSEDELTLLNPATNFVTTAGTGTISTSGTAVNGVGTSFNTQFTGPSYITSGGVTRLVVTSTSATTATLSSPFPANLTAGSTFTIQKPTIQQRRSQAHGWVLSNSNDNGHAFINCSYGVGNITANNKPNSATYTEAITADTIGAVAQMIKSSAVQVSVTGTLVETTMATITVPAGAMGPNGFVEITSLWSYTNSANNKIMRTRFGGTSVASNVPTTTASSALFTTIANRNSASSQVIGLATQIIGVTGSATGTSAVNTANATDITLTATLANTGETITLEFYSVKIVYGA